MIRQVLQGLLTPRLSRSGFLGAARFSNNKKPEEKQDEEEDDIDDRKVNPEEENESSGISYFNCSKGRESSQPWLDDMAHSLLVINRPVQLQLLLGGLPQQKNAGGEIADGSALRDRCRQVRLQAV